MNKNDRLLNIAELHGNLALHIGNASAAHLHRQLAEEFWALAQLELPPVVVVPTPPVSPPPPIERRVGRWIEPMRITVKVIQERPDRPKPQNGCSYILKDLFTTRDGSWEPKGDFGSVDSWARETYLKPPNAADYFDDAGGNHHLFGAVLGLDGKLIWDQRFRYWSNGFETLGNPTYWDFLIRPASLRSGWANLPIFASYVPERGEQGPWCWAPEGASDVVVGGGMPANQHISTFAVWQMIKEA